jgi:hypothetical protein
VHKGRLEAFSDGVIAALLLVLLSGCASEPPRIPPDVRPTIAAVVRAWSPGDVRVEAIDGIEIGNVTHVLVAPGEHQITVRWTGEQSIVRVGQVRGVLQSRSTYVIEAEPDGARRTVLFSLVDKGPDYDPQCLEQRLLGGEPRGRAC